MDDEINKTKTHYKNNSADHRTTTDIQNITDTTPWKWKVMVIKLQNIKDATQ